MVEKAKDIVRPRIGSPNSCLGCVETMIPKYDIEGLAQNSRVTLGLGRSTCIVILVAALVAGAIITFAITYPHPSSVGAFTSVSTTTDTVTAISVSTITTTSFVDPTEALADAYLSHISAIASGNETADAAQYETNATLLWGTEGNPPNGNGSIDGSANIARFYDGGGAFPLLTSYAIANETHSVTMSNDDKAGNVISTLILYGTRIEGSGPPNVPPGTTTYDLYYLGFNISYVLQGDHWLISAESLTYNGTGYCPAIVLSSNGSVLTCSNES